MGQLHSIPDDQFVALWNGATSLAEVVEWLCEASGGRVPRWAVVARAIAVRNCRADLKPLPLEGPANRTGALARVRELAAQLMDRHGLHGWQFGLNGNVRRAGVCKYPTRSRPGRIELSRHFVARNSETEVLDTILHEIAHALVGPEHGHDEVWKAKCLEIGARPERCYGEQVEMPKGRWRAVCPSCRKEFDRHRRPKKLTGWHCKPCGKDRGPLRWQEAG